MVYIVWRAPSSYACTPWIVGRAGKTRKKNILTALLNSQEAKPNHEAFLTTYTCTN